MFGFDRSKFLYEHFDENPVFFMSKDICLPNFAYELDLRGYKGICAIDFYEDIFDNTTIKLEAKRSKKDYVTGEYGAIALEINERYKKRTTITRDLEELMNLINTSDNFCLMSPISYAGKNRTNKNMRNMYALVVEIDHLKPNGEGLDNLFYSFERDRRPNLMPTYMVCSGSGLHLYYKFKEPYPMFSCNQIKLTRIKKTMTFNLWNYIAVRGEKIQYESINQAFRIVGTRTKRDSLAMAFQISDNLITIEDLEKCYNYDESEYRRQPSKFTLIEAKEKFPEWYQTRIIEKKPRKSPQFHKNRAVYDSWKERIYKFAVEGTRFYCMEQLCALAVVCNIDREELVKDCYELLPEFDRRTRHDDNHFTESDVKSALATFNNPNDGTYCRKLSTIYRKTNINLPRVRRNGRTQQEHLIIARVARDIKNPEWRCKDSNGRPTKEKEIKLWRENNPQGTKAQCHKKTKISRPTIDKYWHNT